MHVQTLIIVPARCGSKGLVDKNIRDLGGKPLLAWTAEQIAEANLANSFAILSTDSEIYAEIGLQNGLKAPFLRPPECAGDNATAIQVIEHSLAWFVAEHGYAPELTMWLQPTSPFRTSFSILQAANMLIEQQLDSVIGCKAIHRNLTSLFYCDDGFLSALDGSKPTQTTRQQTRPLLTPNGAMYLCKTKQLVDNQSFYPKKTSPLVMNSIQSHDIDTEEDWMIAEAFIKQGLI
jgi:N-acylneuraminate cytidylyltransferase/CMP-N,N'-diacetyllegionaminic acid synthase